LLQLGIAAIIGYAKQTEKAIWTVGQVVFVRNVAVHRFVRTASIVPTKKDSGFAIMIKTERINRRKNYENEQ